MNLVPFEIDEKSSVEITGDVSFKNEEFRLSFGWHDPLLEIKWPSNAVKDNRKEKVVELYQENFVKWFTHKEDTVLEQN